MSKSITFAGLSLQSTNWLTKDIIYRNIPNKQITTEQLGRRDGFRVVNTYYSQKEIEVNGVVADSSESALRATIDTMKEYLNKDEQNLDIDDGGTTIRYSATLSEFSVPEEFYHITEVPFSLRFLCQPFGKTTTAVTSSASVTSTASSGAFNPLGSANPYPQLKWQATGTPTHPITKIIFTNSTTNNSITISSLVIDAKNDYVIVDTNAMTVKSSYDGAAEVSIDFDGVFPSFNTNTNSYTVSVTTTNSFALKQSIIYYPSYL